MFHLVTLKNESVIFHFELVRVRRNHIEPSEVDLTTVQVASHFYRRETDTWVRGIAVTRSRAFLANLTELSSCPDRTTSVEPVVSYSSSPARASRQPLISITAPHMRKPISHHFHKSRETVSLTW